MDKITQIIDPALTGRVLEAFYAVHYELGYGFLEKVYERALLIELRKRSLDAVSQVECKVFYGQEVIGHYYADILVEGRLILELKAAEVLADEHVAQLLNYLKASRVEVGFVMNFGRKATFRRVIYTNDRKRN